MTRIFALFLFCVSAHAYSQEASRPLYKVGDKWLVERFDLWKKEVSGSRENRVVEISQSSMKIENKDPNTGRVTLWITDLDGNTLAFGGRKFDPIYINYSFPLSVGKKWRYKVSGPGRARIGTFSEEGACDVLAYEDVPTKAGTLKAYKIKCDGTYTSTAGGDTGSGETFSTRWYSPEARFYVKHEYKSTTPRGVWDQYVDQLVSFELQK